MAFLTRKAGGRRAGLADWACYAYLAVSLLVILLPIVWLILSSFKPESELTQYPPTILPDAPMMLKIDGQPSPLPAYRIEGEESIYGLRAQVGRIAVLIDPEDPENQVRVEVDKIVRVSNFRLELSNYLDPLTARLSAFDFPLFLFNSTFIAVMATALSVMMNSMAGYALSRYKFRSRIGFLLLVVIALMIPQTVILVPLFLVVNTVGLYDSIWGAILPVAATPVGIFLMRQYMLSLPEDLFEAARIDGGSEWQIFWRVAVPLSMPAIAVLTILSIIWRWNDFLWPLIVLPSTKNYTLQLGLNAFQGEFEVQWHYLLAMGVLSLLPVTLIFAFLQKSITGGIATTGLK